MKTITITITIPDGVEVKVTTEEKDERDWLTKKNLWRQDVDKMFGDKPGWFTWALKRGCWEAKEYDTLEDAIPDIVSGKLIIKNFGDKSKQILRDFLALWQQPW